MARSFVRANTEYSQHGQYTGLNLDSNDTMCWGIWVQIIDTGNTQWIMGIHRANVGELGWNLYMGTDEKLIWGVSKHNVVEDSITDTVALSTDTWYAVHASRDASEIHLYKNGTEIGTGFTNTFSDGNQSFGELFTCIRYSGGNKASLNLSELFELRNTVWTDNQISAFSKGIPALIVNGAELECYTPFYGNESPEQNLTGSANKTNPTLNETPPKFAGNPPTELLENYL